ncbi:MAG: hypothetical protein JSS43_19770 [Proteobacteria bacterium]|nr:hypothetical protein [Pseudomonadota bacterium]
MDQEPTSKGTPDAAKFLISYDAIIRAATTCEVNGGLGIQFSVKDFENILRHFLRFAEFCDPSYLEANPDLADAIKSGRYKGSAREHFLQHGYFEGRRQFPGHDLQLRLSDADLLLPDNFFCLLQMAQIAVARGYSNRALRLLSVAQTRYGPRPVLASLVAKCYVTVGQYQKGVIAFEAIGLSSLTGDDILALWVAYKAENRHLNALRLLETALSRALRPAEESLLRLKLAETQWNLADVTGTIATLRLLSRTALDSSAAGLVEIATRALLEKRERIKALLPRVGTLSPRDEADFVLHLAWIGFRRVAARRLPHVKNLLSAEPCPDDEAVRCYLDAVWFCLGPEAVPEAYEPFAGRRAGIGAITAQAAALYALGRYDEAVYHLDMVADEARDDYWFQLKVDSHAMGNQAATALEYCDEWRKALPTEFLWAPAALRIHYETGEMVDTQINVDLVKPEAECLIPATIVQFWNDEAAPGDVEACMRSWQMNNPDFVYRRFDSRSACDFINRWHGPDAVAAFERCYHPAMQADYFRLAFLYRFGGCYVDADEESILPLSILLSNCPDRSLVLVRTDTISLLNSPMLVVPNHPLIGHALSQATSVILRHDGRPPIWQTTGPGLIMRVFIAGILDRHPEFLRAIVIKDTDAARFASEKQLEYKSDVSRNWRTV